jgi:hypothetical protein
LRPLEVIFVRVASDARAPHPPGLACERTRGAATAMRSVPRRDTRGEKAISPNAKVVETDVNWFSPRDHNLHGEYIRSVFSVRWVSFTREIAETKPFADVVRMRQKLISEKHKLNGNESSVRIKKHKLICFFSTFPVTAFYQDLTLNL